jgi:hypothetical protein
MVRHIRLLFCLCLKLLFVKLLYLMTPAKRKRSTLPVKKEHKPMTQAFLDHLSMDEAKAWRNEISQSSSYFFKSYCGST